MNNQDHRNEFCQDIAELFGALPETNDASTDKVRWERELILDLIGDRLDRLRELGLEWR